MKLNGKEIMYRTFKGYNVQMKVIDENENISVEWIYVDGKFNGIQDIMNTAKTQYEITNPGSVVFKVIVTEEVNKKIAMYIDDFVKNGFEVDDDFKPVGE